MTSEFFESRENIEKYRERIKDGIWRPGILVPFEKSVGAGMSTKQLKELVGIRGGVRITAKCERFDKEFSEQTKEERRERFSAGRILTRLLQELDPQVDPHNVVKTVLVHGNRIIHVTREYLEQEREAMARVEADGLITRLTHIPLMVAAADCAPVGIYDDERKAIGLFHSGWRGTFQEIVPAGIAEMKRIFGSDPEIIKIFVGPYSGSRTYEVGQDVYEKFKDAQHPDGTPLYSTQEMEQIFKPSLIKEDAYIFDNGLAIKISVIKTGVPEHNIEVSQHSTMEENELFSSERIEGREKRDSNILLLVLRS